VNAWCNDNSLCTIDNCNASVPGADSRGCYYVDVNCDVYDKCNIGVCDRWQGCETLPVECLPVSDSGQNMTCVNAGCNRAESPTTVQLTNYNASVRIWQTAFSNGNTTAPMPRSPYCVNEPIPWCTSSLTTILAGSIGAAAIVGIVLGIVLCLGCTGGGVYAVANARNLDKDASTMNNPLYKGARVAAYNPLNRL